MGNRYSKSDENEKILYKEATNFYSWSMSEFLRYDEIKVDEVDKLEGTSNTPDDSGIGHFLEFFQNILIILMQKQRMSPFALKTKLVLRINLLVI